MSFSTCSSFSTNYWTLSSVQLEPSHQAQPASSLSSVYAGAGGSGSQISVSHSTSMWGGDVRDLECIGVIQSEKESMQLNDCPVSQLERWRSLKAEYQRLESKIWEHLEKKGPQVRAWGHYFKTIEDPKAQIFASSVDKAHITLHIDNAHLAADDFRLKYEMELAMNWSMESDINGLQRQCQYQLETEIEALKEQLLFMKKNHEEEVNGLQNQIDNGLTMELDAPKSQDLSKIMADTWAQYEELAQKNQEDPDKCWSQLIEASTTVVTSQATDIGAAEMIVKELRHMVQSLEVDLDSIRNLKTSLENSLREVETGYAMQMQLTGILLQLESDLAQPGAEGQHQAQEYEALLNKVKLEAESTTDQRLLKEEEDFGLGDALDNSNSIQIQKTSTHRIVGGKVVSEVKNTKVLRC
uniref:IF rod domain-containing protein n=1 Tax=Myotis lucifugus TaxID=59463 RepID=G1Q9N8_MYOLU